MTTYRQLVLVTLLFAAGCGDNGNNRDRDAATACTDPASCGACGTHCSADEVCASGACVATCPSGTTACNGSCVDTTSDVANCGTCGAVCSTAHGTATCTAGTCGVAACADGSYGSEGACHPCTAIAGCATESCATAYESTCLACEPGNYLSGNTCVACSGACADGSYQTAACSATADRACGACTPISGCDSVTCSSAADSACTACAAGNYLDQNSCHACSTDACPAGGYESVACSATADRACSACTAIPGCTDEVCTTSTDATCQACAPGTYLSGNACVACSTDTCPTGTYETAACSATADRACTGCAAIAGCADEVCTTATDATCLACTPGTFLSGNACAACSTDACPTGTYETAACSATADRTCGCTAIANCTAETCSNATDESCTACDAGHYVSGGTCATCSACRPGEFTETACGGSADVTCAALDCYTLHISSPALGDGVYKIDPDGAGGAAPFDAYCDMTTSGGGWTLLMKVDGSLTTFTYASPLWTNATPYQPDSCALDEVSETKSAGFATMPFNAMRVGMFDFTDAHARWLELEHANSSLLDLFTSGYQPLAEGRDAWKTLVANPSLQPYCNMEGFNVDAPWGVGTRIGIVSNQEYDCGTPDSRIGIGTQGDNCGQDTNHSSGDEARCGGDGGDVSTPTFGYVMVRNCPGGVCDCGPALTSCGALCMDIQADPKNCGACGYACGQQNGVDACVAGSCQITCNPGWGDCDQQASTGCETYVEYDDANCGACGNACATGLSCRAGTCVDLTELRIDNPSHATIEYLPQNDRGRDDPAEGTCIDDCTVHPTIGNRGGVRLRSPSGFASGCDYINQLGQCIVYLPGHVVLN